MKPSQVLFHGTSLDYSEAIEEQGLVKQNFDVVFLTSDVAVAYQYAMKRVYDYNSNTLQPVICVVNAVQMSKEGFCFQHNIDTAEWTIEHVPSEYIVQVAVESEDDLENVVKYALSEYCL